MILETAGLILLIVVSMFLLTPLIRAAIRQRAMDRWPRVTGFVEAHHVREEENRDCVILEYRVRYQTAGTRVRVDVRRCRIARGSPRLHTVGPRVDVSSGPPSHARLDRFPVGQTIVVMANPADPAQAYLVQRELPLTVIALSATTILVGFIVTTVRILFLP